MREVISVRIIAVVLFSAFIQGCTALMPNTISLEQAHISHISQHFGNNPTNYGIDTLNIVARWQSGNAYAEVSEGATIGCERLDGMREVFSARVGYSIPLK